MKIKNSLLVLGTIAALVLSACSKDESSRVLTFEGSYWSALVDNPQYGGPLLYGESYTDTSWGYPFTSYLGGDYKWCDSDWTMLQGEVVDAGGRVFWNGGSAVSNYVDGVLADGTYLNQLAVYKEASSAGNVGGGHDGSDNFCVHNGDCTLFSFSDGAERVIDHMYVNNTLYAMNVMTSGDYAIKSGDWFKVVATGYDALGKETGTAEILLADGPSKIVKTWTKWDLSSLGAVARIDVQFSASSSQNNAYGVVIPMYFAFDDVSVRF